MFDMLMERMGRKHYDDHHNYLHAHPIFRFNGYGQDARRH